MKEAIDLSIESLRQHGEAVPTPSSTGAAFIEAA
jgi:predicted RNase H-like HicB family nuclease